MPRQTATRFFQTGSPEKPVRLRDGGMLPGVTIAYETWGTLNADQSNAVFLFHVSGVISGVSISGVSPRSRTNESQVAVPAV